ncbi:hypothetical protein [Paludibacterium purpuratum]|uniref:Uncharacterized protein n=1 Tax=Paludibacterium purpuratum TaxID=1144873 RepID=A0A4R7BGD9_9NEIS|nr:hypothetical protein [Paludibacterium purpuratum]TDR82786.1 hypothetical protein DFP86_101175 [Paludibacterium purpuratum]
MNPAVHTPVTQQYLDARLEAVELRMDARVQRIEDKMDLFAQSMQQMQQSIKEVCIETHSAIATLQGDTQHTIEKFQAETQSAIERLQVDTKSLKNTVLMTGISSVVAIVLGVAAFNSTVLGNMVASFEAGNSSAQLLARIQAQQEKHDKKMEEIVLRIEQRNAAAPQ